MAQASMIVTSYGVVAAATFLSGALCDAIGTAMIGIGLSAHVPITPLITAHAHGETGSALAILNLGAGLGAFVGPGVVTLLLGDDTTAGGYLWVALALAGLYVISFGLCFALKLPGNARVLTAPPAIEDSEEAPGQDHRHSLAPVQALGASASSLPAGAA